MQPLVDILRALRAADVRFVVVGGVAVTLQGHGLATCGPRREVDRFAGPHRKGRFCATTS